ncbi:DMT family transporter [Echinimonas agarilytica]|uniref:DMT family transporter n=1 Tax=Echinimonas agarilytica TaxID=1215918 RepID=A0AA42B8R7_9GAMM|nr:DMT family transporter [Echinimonas agarilytica]MCM2680813.1 DMT family transporter [Echinimonas agarilytica]
MPHHLLPQVALVFAAMLWGSSFIALKIAFDDYPALLVIFFRMLAASVCFLLVWKRLKHFEYRTGDWKLLLLMSLAEPCLYFVFEGLALQHTSASQAGMITALLPPMVAVLAFITLKERLNRTSLIGFGLAFSGVVLLSALAESDLHAPNPLLGNVYELIAMVCAAVYCLCLKTLSSRYSPVALTALQAFAGSIFFAPAAIWVGFPEQHSWSGIMATLYLGVGVTLGAYLLYNTAIAHIELSRATAFTNLIPIFTLVFAYAVLGEQLGLTQLMACGVILVGVLISQWCPSSDGKPRHAA